MIHMLKTEKIRPEILEAHYGSSAPENVLRILHRDALLSKEKSVGEDVYEMPISEVSAFQVIPGDTENQRAFQMFLFNLHSAVFARDIIKEY